MAASQYRGLRALPRKHPNPRNRKRDHKTKHLLRTNMSSHPNKNLLIHSMPHETGKEDHKGRLREPKRKGARHQTQTLLLHPRWEDLGPPWAAAPQGGLLGSHLRSPSSQLRYRPTPRKEREMLLPHSTQHRLSTVTENGLECHVHLGDDPQGTRCPRSGILELRQG